MTFDMEATFGDDYPYFYEESIDDARLGMLTRPRSWDCCSCRPGPTSSTCPVGTGGCRAGCAAAGMAVTGVDLTPAYVEDARADPHLRPGSVTYLEGDIRALPVDGPFDAVVCWLNSFGYYDDDDCHKVLEESPSSCAPVERWRSTRCTTTPGVRHFTPAPDAVVVQRDDDAMFEVSTFDPITGRMLVERTAYRDGTLRRASYFIRLPTPPEWVVWLEAAGFHDVQFRAGGGGPLELDSWELAVTATA